MWSFPATKKGGGTMLLCFCISINVICAGACCWRVEERIVCLLERENVFMQLSKKVVL